MNLIEQYDSSPLDLVHCTVFISRDHLSRASMMMFLGNPRNISVRFPLLYTSSPFLKILADPNSAHFRILSNRYLTSITFKLVFKFIFGTDPNAPITTVHPTFFELLRQNLDIFQLSHLPFLSSVHPLELPHLQFDGSCLSC